MGNTLEDVLQQLKVPNNACHQNKKKPILRDYTIRGQILSTVDRATYLGVELSSDLTWNKQVEKMAAKANRILSFIRRSHQICSIITEP